MFDRFTTEGEARCRAVRRRDVFTSFILATVTVFTVVLLILVVLPGVGYSVNGSSRWLRFAGFRFQPSELAKVSMILLFAWWLARNQRRIDEFKRGIVIPFVMLGCFALAIMPCVFSQSDHG